MPLALTLHLLAAVIWVGGMFFAYLCLRPVAAARLEPPQRLAVWSGVFARFFPVVWGAVVLLPLTGYWMFAAGAGGWHVHTMQALGWVMIALFVWLFFAPWRTLRARLAADDLPGAAAALNRIRHVVAVNLTLGLLTVVVAAAGRYLAP